MTVKELSHKADRHYIYFLRYTVPTKKQFDKAPANLLELLDNSYKRKMNLRGKL